MTPPPSPDLSVEDLSVVYGACIVISRQSIPRIGSGELTALVGPNAAGKSTLLRALAGLVPARGSIRLGTAELSRLDGAARATRMSFMPQSLPAVASLRVLESVIAAMRASPFGHGAVLAEGELRHRAVLQLEGLGIADLALRFLDQLSGGQRQLVGLAQALVREPDVLLLDEPTSALDLKYQHRVMRFVQAFARSGRVVVVVLHDLALAAHFADRVIVLAEGRVHSEGPTSAVLTTHMLREVYGVEARVQSCERGKMTIIVDGEASGPSGCRRSDAST